MHKSGNQRIFLAVTFQKMTISMRKCAKIHPDRETARERGEKNKRMIIKIAQ